MFILVSRVFAKFFFYLEIKKEYSASFFPGKVLSPNCSSGPKKDLRNIIQESFVDSRKNLKTETVFPVKVFQFLNRSSFQFRQDIKEWKNFRKHIKKSADDFHSYFSSEHVKKKHKKEATEKHL